MFGCLKSDDSWDLTVALGKDAKKRNLRDCICKCICCVKRSCKVDSCDEDLVRTPAQGLKTKQDLLAASAPSASFAQRLSVLCIPELFKVMTTVQNKAPLINPYFSEGLACFTRPLHCPFLHISTTSSTTHAPKSNLDTSIVHSSPIYQNALHIMDEPSLSEAHPPPASAGEVNEDHQTKQARAQADRSDSCSSCGKPAKYVCIFCERAPAATGYPLGPTHYRSVECQTADWEHHEVCKAARDRQLIYEKGAALQREHREYCRDFVMEMVRAGTLNASHMIMHEKDSVQGITDAITLLHDMKGNVEERRAFFACIDASARLLNICKSWKKRLLGMQDVPNEYVRAERMPTPSIPLTHLSIYSLQHQTYAPMSTTGSSP